MGTGPKVHGIGGMEGEVPFGPLRIRNEYDRRGRALLRTHEYST